MKRPFISVVIPTYNSAKFITQTLNSALKQTYNNFEVVVTDSGSVDRTKEIVEDIFSKDNKIKKRLVENPDMGPGRNRNRGIKAAEGEWIAFLDSDDLWRPDKLTKVAEAISNQPEIDLWCHSETVRLGNKEVKLEHYQKFNSHINPFLSIYRENSLSTSAVTVRKDALFKVGLFEEDESFAHAEDWELWLRLVKVARIGYLKDILGEYVLRSDGLISEPIKTFKARLRIAKKHHQEIKKVSGFYFIEELRFKGKVFSAAGSIFLSQRKWLEGLFFMGVGFLYWPFRYVRLQSRNI